MPGALFRIIVASVIAIVNVGLGYYIGKETANTNDQLAWILSLSIGGYILGFLLTPFLVVRPWRWLKSHNHLISVQSIIAAAIGLAFALGAAALSTLPLSTLPDPWDMWAPLGLAIFLCLIFIPVMVLQGPAVMRFFFSAIPSQPAPGEIRSNLLIVDTNAIIDGRIADIIKIGYIDATLVIPKFVLNELQHIADSSDALRRNRGRRGLEMLTQLQRGSDVPVQISDIDFQDTLEVDAKLVRLAKTLHCPIVSNDFNLNKVAKLQGIKVLNINELANAVKPVVLPGEDMTLRIVQEGKEPGQGIGFLDDGTMVVVEGGRRYLNTEISVAVTRVLQTAAGRMIFAQPKEPVDEKTKR